ncbi:MAG: 50S ribosomal protein L4 [Patescibacteria group bacterium]
MLKIDVYTLKAKKNTTQITLPKHMEGDANPTLLSQAVHVYRDRMHTGLTKSKTRSEVNRTTKKVYKQKGTGGARHGSRRAPIYVGGGTAHGPKLESRVKSLSQKMRIKALAAAIEVKVKAGEVLAIEGISTIKKTKDAAKLSNFGRKTLVLSDKNMAVARSLKNLKDTKIVLLKDLNAYNVLMGGKLVFDAAIFEGQNKAAVKKTVTKKVKKETTKK